MRPCVSSSTQNVMLIFIITSFKYVIYYTNTGSNQIAENYWSHKTTLWQVLSHITNGIQKFVKCCIKGWVHLDLWPDSMLFDRLQHRSSMLLSGRASTHDAVNHQFNHPFQPVVHDCYKLSDIYCPVFGMMHIKDPLLLIRKSSTRSVCSMVPFIIIWMVLKHVSCNLALNKVFKFVNK